MTSIAELQQFLPAGLHGPEWVGPVVLIFVAAGTWNAVRAPSAFHDFRPARLHAIASLCAIVLGVWIGVSIHPLLGAALLGAGCCLSLWSVLLSLGVTWRNHIRPVMVPALLVTCAFAVGLYRPRSVVLFAILLLWWATTVRHSVIAVVDRQIQGILTRVLVLTHFESAEYFIHEWFTRFAPGASDLQLLAVACGSAERVRLYPRAGPVAIATETLALLATLAEQELDHRLRTDDTAGRTTSWIRTQTKDLVTRSIRQSRIPKFLNFLSMLMLAIPPARGETWTDRAGRGGSIASSADPEGYIVNIIAELPRIPTGQDLQAVRDQVLGEFVQSGPDWLSRLADWAEQWREQTFAEGRDRRIEVVAEVLWGIYEADIGPRPSRYELFDQLRLQLPDLLDGLAVREARLDERSDLLLLSVMGMPRRFDQLTRWSNGSRTASRIVLESRDRRRWALQRLEVTAEDEVLIVFRPETE